jgi:hypothetical protein
MEKKRLLNPKRKRFLTEKDKEFMHKFLVNFLRQKEMEVSESDKADVMMFGSNI